MKFKIKNITKSFGDQKVLDNVSFEFNEKTFYAISGHSGCGKSTLLNLMSLLLKPDNGEIFYGIRNLLNLKENDKKDFRLNNIGFIFQSFNLFEDDTVFNNIALVLDSTSSYKKEMRERKVDEVLRLIKIEYLKDKYVKDLSGGEKQRVAIARAIINNPKIIFADEPTGSLDSVNSEEIFKLLRKLKKIALVIVVTHDKELANRYCDEIIEIKDRNLSSYKVPDLEDEIMRFSVMVDQNKSSKGILHDKFIYRHIKNRIKKKKGRTIINIVLLVISFFSIGLSFSLKQGISNALNNSFKEIMGENSLILKRKNDDTKLIDYYGATEYEVNNIKNSYKNKIDYYGVRYLGNFENIFIDQNNLILISTAQKSAIEGFNLRSFNEFSYVKDFNDYEIYPYNIDVLSDKEIVISLNYEDLSNLCRALYIPRSYEDMGRYLKTNTLSVKLILTNRTYNLFESVDFNIKGIIASNVKNIYHTNNLFNKEVFENYLPFKGTNNLKTINDDVFCFKKLFYLHTKEFQSSFLNEIMFDNKYANYLLDNDSHIYSPKSCSLYEISYSNKLFVFKTYKKDVSLDVINKIKRMNLNLDSYYFSSSGGYLNLGGELLNGFSERTFFANNREKIDELIDSFSKIKTSEVNSIKIRDDILEGNIMNLEDKTVKLTSKKRDLISGELPTKINEICISTLMANKIGLNLNDDLYVSTIVNKEYYGDYFKYDFKTIKLKISGIFENSKALILGTDYFSLTLFRDLFQVSASSLLINSIVFDIDYEVSKDDLKKLNTYFDEYEFISPLNDLDLGIEDTLSFLELILLITSIVTMISSAVLMIIINYIEIIDTKKDYAILNIIGFQNKEIIKLILYNIIFPILIALISASILIFLTYFLVNNVISINLGVLSNIYISFTPFLIIILFGLLILLITYIILLIPLRKLEIIRNVH